MTDLVPAPSAPGGSLLGPLSGSSGGSAGARIGAFLAQPAVKKALPWFAGAVGAGLLALTWATLSPAPQRVLYSQLDDGERSSVAAALDAASIGYTIDNGSGALTVAEDDFYRARMLVASDGALAAPQTGTEMLDSLPMGASRTLEGDRLRAAQERDLTLSIMEIDGVESVRVHLARAERSVFVRDNVAPTASVMVRMARGRQMAASQVTAIANLVAGSVPGLTMESVRIVDQNGRLLSQADGEESDRLELQARMEAKLRGQVEQLLAPMVGVENFSSEIQVELDMDEVTSARESYDKDGSVRRETTQSSQGVSTTAAGVPGVLSNTPPAEAQAVPGAPEGGPAEGQQTQGATGESSASRTYELGREVAVSNTAPGGLKRLSVAVALNQDALKGAKPADLAKFEQLVSAAVGANTERGDTVAVVVRPFKPVEVEPAPFWETPWFATVLRNVVALLAVILVLFLAVRPAIRALTRRGEKAETDGEMGEGPMLVDQRMAGATGTVQPMSGDSERINAQIELAQRIVREKPDDALLALRRMLSEPQPNEGAVR